METTKILSFKSISSKISLLANIFGKNHQIAARWFTSNILEKNRLLTAKQPKLITICSNVDTKVTFANRYPSLYYESNANKPHLLIKSL
jgi:hypothetical protein